MGGPCERCEKCASRLGFEGLWGVERVRKSTTNKVEISSDTDARNYRAFTMENKIGSEL